MFGLNRMMASLDIADQLGRALQMVRSVDNAIIAAMVAFVLTAINFVLWPWIWYFDIDATREFGEVHAQLIRDLPVPVPMPDPALAGLLLMGGLLLPTLVEMGTPLLARFGVAIASWLFWMCVAIDSFTDYPQVAAFVEPYRPDVWWQVPAFWLARMVLLFFATLGFEFWMAVTSVVVLTLVLRGLSLSSPRTRRGRTYRNDYPDDEE